ncbi:hypothetical protein BBK14_29935 [Parafrankia soli]|uniref:Uncharacterized protein n=1 Tax=Parafrankia soli TaxID=2599596 RepID=A0A1S1RK85_9ACTN|nr:hypothetical protein [Parafrankia soli]OHV45835.1 hypothetical protein BBK14_29935 [Parafrankia soli]
MLKTVRSRSNQPSTAITNPSYTANGLLGGGLLSTVSVTSWPEERANAVASVLVAVMILPP